MNEALPLDVAVVGAGLAGAAAATVLASDGRRVTLIDPKPVYPPAFKAEKIEPDQADILRRLGLMDGMRPHIARIHSIEEAHGGRVLNVRPIEQYGAPYQDMVNAVQRQMPAGVDRRTAKVAGITPGADLQTLALDTGETITARLTVLAAGTGGKLHESLGITRRTVRNPHSLCTGFDIARAGGGAFPFDSLTYYADTIDDGIDYVTLFVVPGAMRVNVFSYRDPKDPWVRELTHAPHDVIHRAVPGLTKLIGPWTVTSKAESKPIDLYVAEPPPLDGVVLIGDASQSVCPATGTGLSKVLTDVEVLCRTHLPAWFATPGMGAAKMAAYYADAAKREVDAHSLATAEYRRQFSTDRSMRWWVHRKKSFARMAWNGRKSVSGR